MSRNREFRDEALRAIREHGARIVDIRQNKHTKISFETEGGAGMISVPCTPSDVRSILNTKADIRRRIAEVEAGTAAAPERPEVRPPQKSRTRVRQYPRPLRRQDHTPAVRFADTERPRREKLTPWADPTPATPQDPMTRARDLLGQMECFAIDELRFALKRAHGKWMVILVDDALGIPYLRGPGRTARLSKTGLGMRFRIWVNRCAPEQRPALWAEKHAFIVALAETAREFADAMPERGRLVIGARDIMERLLAEGKAWGRLPDDPSAWPAILKYVPEEAP